MTLNSEFRDFCDRWLQKAEDYDTIDLNQCFDKFFTLYVVYNALYVETAALLHRKAKKEGRDEYKLEDGRFPDESAATKYVLDFLKSRSLMDAFESDEKTKHALTELISVIQIGQFNIQLDPVWGRPQRVKDRELLTSLKSNNTDEKARAILKIIYAIRCNMFHGRKGLHPVQKELLTPLINILEKVINLLRRRLERPN
jgi:hypothetical protein